jgi:hypothetical protein
MPGSPNAYVPAWQPPEAPDPVSSTNSRRVTAYTRHRVTPRGAPRGALSVRGRGTRNPRRTTDTVELLNQYRLDIAILCHPVRNIYCPPSES